ncbi:MAG: ankyrin repeat domain-containing protein [bacterium]
MEDLHWLAESGQLDRLRGALAAGADVEARDDLGRTPLHVATLRRRLDVVRALADAGASLEAVQTAVPGQRPLHLACLPAPTDPAGDVPLVEMLLARGVDPAPRDARGTTPLHLAVAWCDSQLVRLFLSKGAPAHVADHAGITPLHVACRRGAPEFADVLLGDDGELLSPQPASREDTALGRLEDEAVMEALLDEGAMPDAADRQGETPLHAAVERGRLDATRILLSRGARVDVADEYGTTPLHRADGARVAELLLDASAPLDPPDREGRTPLHQAIAAARDDVVDLLLERGASLAVADHDGLTALHLAAAAGRALIVEKLLDEGADANVRDAEGRTPLFWATAAGHTHVMATLKRHGGRRRR